jgi:hypothetical protein
MSRPRALLLSAALIAAFVVPIGTATAATTITYQLSGTAAPSLFPQVTFSGTAKAKPGKESGQWSAVFSYDIGAIIDGTFTLTSRVRTVSDPIVGGTFGPSAGDCATTTIPVHGRLASGGSFDVTLTRIGSLVNGSCVVSSSTVRGTATLLFP